MYSYGLYKGAEIFTGRRIFFTSNSCVHFEVMHSSSREVVLQNYFEPYNAENQVRISFSDRVGFKHKFS